MDYPTKFLISKDETKAFIVEHNHGFYILNIKDEKNPKLMGSLKDIKGVAMVLSHDEKTLFIGNKDPMV